MKIAIKDFCIRCGLCEDLYPELYRINYEKDAIDILVEEVPEELREKARKSVADCAVTAIYLVAK
ncbi:MAG: Fer [Firmicutes bacterium]|nr:Fer [Bacillota bacterium]